MNCEFGHVSVRQKKHTAVPESTALNRRLAGALIEQDIRQHIQECLLCAYADALDTRMKGMAQLRG